MPCSGGMPRCPILDRKLPHLYLKPFASTCRASAAFFSSEKSSPLFTYLKPFSARSLLCSYIFCAIGIVTCSTCGSGGHSLIYPAVASSSASEVVYRIQLQQFSTYATIFVIHLASVKTAFTSKNDKTNDISRTDYGRTQSGN